MLLTHDHEELERTLKRFIDQEINPHVDEWEAAEAFPAHEVFRRLGELGLLGLTKPTAYGGSALDYSFRGHGANLGPCGLWRHSHGDWRADRHGHAGIGPIWVA